MEKSVSQTDTLGETQEAAAPRLLGAPSRPRAARVGSPRGVAQGRAGAAAVVHAPGVSAQDCACQSRRIRLLPHAPSASRRETDAQRLSTGIEATAKPYVPHSTASLRGRAFPRSRPGRGPRPLPPCSTSGASPPQPPPHGAAGAAAAAAPPAAGAAGARCAGSAAARRCLRCASRRMAWSHDDISNRSCPTDSDSSLASWAGVVFKGGGGMGGRFRGDRGWRAGAGERRRRRA